MGASERTWNCWRERWRGEKANERERIEELRERLLAMEDRIRELTLLANTYRRLCCQTCLENRFEAEKMVRLARKECDREASRTEEA